MSDATDAADQPATPVDVLVSRFGPARRPQRSSEHPRPEGMSDATVEALARLGKALEAAEDARGHLYAFHRLSGRADLQLQDAVQALREAGHDRVADTVHDVLVGRDVVPGMWTFQIVEAYDANYAQVFRTVEQSVRAELGGAAAHLAEAEMKVREQR